MDIGSERFRLRQIERLLSNQLHEAEERSRLAKAGKLPQVEQAELHEAMLLALRRWQAFVIRREVPGDLKDWDGTVSPRNSTKDF